ncbi:MAG: hypothetical protein BWK78_02630, partial [Thiotrichaceae bacterium IS1]
LALVIGNAAYAEKPLKNPVNDAKDMAKVLEELGFQVILRTNVDLNTMIDTLREFGNRLSEGGVGLFYFSGHGIQYNNFNYLIPINTNNLEDDELVIKRDTLGVDDILSRMESNNKRGVNILILDACRNNPFGGRDFKSVLGKGLAEMRAPIGSLIAYATAPNAIAKDNPKGLNGMYTKHLLAVLREMPQESILDLFTEVTRRVVVETNEQQVPWKADSLRGKFCLAVRGCGRVAIQSPVEVTESTPSQVPSIPKSPSPSVEIQETGDCRDYETIAVIEGQRESLWGKACRQNDGFWKPSPISKTEQTSGYIAGDDGVCHDYQTIVKIDGQRQVLCGKACQQRDGSWEFAPTAGYAASNDSVCRRYETVAMINGQQQVLYGKACRQRDNSWVSVDYQ